ncbi:nucleolar protein 12 [Topomyia yanbarensis]|uniref:nucleolar protein 12 n=1 Tax=Topomyia yanbarensis TaxID=2498891 RepID=UPI00273A8C89|nr:nucleolar protein 12 [Topomyia yanbarensis]
MKRKSQDGNKPSFVKRKIEIVFDPKQRAEFLTGFHKRKLHRKKVAQNDVQRKLKSEVRRIRNEAKDNVKKLYHSYKPIPELTDQDPDEQEYDTENVTVKVVELSTTDLAKENNWIGENRPVIHGDEEDEESSDISSSDEEIDLKAIPGMELGGAHSKKKKKQPEQAQEDECNGKQTKLNRTSASEKSTKQRGPVLNLEGVASKKELNRKLKRHALKSRLKSKPFQQSARAQQQKQLKKSRRVKHFKEKHLKRKGKFQVDKKGKGKNRGGRDG